MKPCNKCGQQIDFQKLDNGKWKPVNTDGTDHRCQGNQQNSNGKIDSDSPDYLAKIVTRTKDRLVLDMGEYRLDIRKEAK